MDLKKKGLDKMSKVIYVNQMSKKEQEKMQSRLEFYLDQETSYTKEEIKEEVEMCLTSKISDMVEITSYFED